MERCPVPSRIWFAILSATVVILVTSIAFGQENSKAGQEKDQPKKTTSTAGAVEVHFVDGSTMKVVLRDDKIELETTYGKLLIPIADVHRIEFGLRISDDVRKRIDMAIADLASSEYRRRQAAAGELLALKEKAYPALVKAARAKDAEASRRAEEILEKMREGTSEDALDIPPHDVVQTASSRIAGQVKGDLLRVNTLPFGDQQVKLADMRLLRTAAAVERESAPAGGGLPDPGTPGMYANQVGKTLTFRLTGPPAGVGGQMGVYGTDVYTMDSSLAASAVHAGAIRPGQTGLVRVTILGQHGGFQASMRNGIMSHAYGPWNAFRIELPKGAAARKN
jgi:hypothetical protein